MKLLIKEHGGNVYKVSRETGLDISDIIDFSANINPLGVPESGKQALVESIEGLVNYPDPDYVEFCKAVGAHHDVDYRRVIPGNGAIDSLYSAVAAVEPKKVLVSVPSFVEYERAVNKVGAEYIPSYRDEEDKYIFNTEKFIEDITHDIDLAIICNPNNPTGDLVAKDDIVKILEKCRKCGSHLLLDEAFMEFAELLDAESSVDLIGCYPELIISRSLTKFYAVPGLRSGYLIVGNGVIRDRIKNASEPWKLNHFADVFSRTVLLDEEYIKATKEWLTQENQKLFIELSKIEWLEVNESYANYIFFKCKKDIDLKNELMKSGIMIRSCTNFDGMGSNRYRVAVKDEKSNNKLLESLRVVEVL